MSKINDTYNEISKRQVKGSGCYNKADTSIKCLKILDHENNETDEFNSDFLLPSKSQFLKQYI